MNLSNFPIREYREKYNLTAFIETGTESGEGCKTAYRGGFKEILSCEIDGSKIYKAKQYLKDLPVDITIFKDNSINCLPDMIKFVEKDNILFWLDAHLPYEQTESNVLPLRKELEIIRELRNENNDVIIIDDMRLYEDSMRNGFNMGDYVNVDYTDNCDIGFISKLFNRHSMEVNLNAERAIVLFPKGMLRNEN